MRRRNDSVYKLSHVEQPFDRVLVHSVVSTVFDPMLGLVEQILAEIWALQRKEKGVKLWIANRLIANRPYFVV